MRLSSDHRWEEPGRTPLPKRGLRDLRRTFPPRVYILQRDGKHLLIVPRRLGLCGLACFRTVEAAHAGLRAACRKDPAFAGMVPQCVPFDEARRLAQAKPAEVAALLLADDPRHPLVHYVR